MSASAEPGRDARFPWFGALLVGLLACLPSVGTLEAPWIAEDALLLAQARAESPWADWVRSQGGMEIVRFWRPAVSASWALQEAWTGIAPAPLRAFNLLLHALASVLALAAAWRLGAGRGGALLAGAWLATFPEQGGTSTWIAGRTDLLCAAFLMASVYAALGNRPLLSAPLAFLACAAKEFGFLAPLWVGVLAFARGARGRSLLAPTAPVLSAAAIALVWRTLALGGVGGYSGVSPPLAAGLAGSARALFEAGWAWAPLLLSMLALTLRRSEARVALAALVLALLSSAMLYDLLASGSLAAQNRRLLYVPDCALALAAGLVAAGQPSRARFRAVSCALLLVTLGRGALAWRDTHEWAGAARLGETRVQQARAVLRAEPPSPRPVFFAGFQGTAGGAYCLGFGVAARFREPFPVSPRPAWPWRLLFVAQGGRERTASVRARPDGSLWPLDDERLVPELGLRAEAGETLTRLALDERVLDAAEDHSPVWLVTSGPAGARLEALLFTEHGYEPIPLGTLDAAGGAQGTLRQLLLCTNGVATAGDVLRQAADLGATQAFLELRALGTDGTVLSASPWVELEWAADLRRRAARSLRRRSPGRLTRTRRTAQR